MSTNSRENNCKHFVMRKKRFCRMTVKPGQSYCGEHMTPSTENSNDSSQLRITCPLDPKHTCYASKLAKHLKICNARIKDQPSYISKGVNACESNQKAVRLLSNTSIEQIKNLVEKINKIHSELIQDKIKENYLKHAIVEDELEKPFYGDKSKKHLIQTSSILGILIRHELLKPDTCYIDFGAGKGHLSFWLAKSLETLENSSVLLVERAAHRHKADNKIEEGRVHRIRADIADLILDEVDVIKKSKHVVGVTKHLCGEATDLAIRCLENMKDNADKALGLVFAFCCHHRCQWNTYVGKTFFENVGLGEDDFNIMCGMVSWATCGLGLARDAQSSPADTQNLKLNERDKQIGLNRDQKADIGIKCKNILNWGRLEHLNTLNFDCSLNYYVKPDISPENICVIAYKKKINDS